MKTRTILPALIATVFASLMLFQISVVTASPLNARANLTTPVTSATYTLAGNFSLRILKQLSPISGAVIKSYNNATGITYTSTTDSYGNYSFNLNDGTYTVSVVKPLVANIATEIFKIIPAFRKVTIQDHDVVGVSFFAIVKR